MNQDEKILVNSNHRILSDNPWPLFLLLLCHGLNPQADIYFFMHISQNLNLCSFCSKSSARTQSTPSKPCIVCLDASLKSDEMIDAAIKVFNDLKIPEDSKKSIKSFCISTKIPSDWLVNEEKIWDFSMEKAEGVKSRLNHYISVALAKKTGLEYDPSDGAYRFVFDYSNGSIDIEPNDLFIFGRYKKHVAGLSQSRWICTNCEGKGCERCNGKGKNFESVEERIGEPFIQASGANSYVMHASGREDVDATNSGGRPFVLELKAAKIRNLDLNSLTDVVAKSKEVSIHKLKIVPRSFCELVTESHFDKTYLASVKFGRDITKEDVQKICSLEGKILAQQTPERVMHRRADLIRHRKVMKISVLKYDGDEAELSIMAEAGTYIKELISGDGGRTKPNIAALTGTEAKCTKLDVSSIEDQFLDFCLTKP